MSERDTRTVSRSRPRTSADNDEGQAHIVMKGDQMRGYLTGEAIMALCGKVWVPSRDYRGLPVCPVCANERDRLVAGMGNLN